MRNIQLGIDEGAVQVENQQRHSAFQLHVLCVTRSNHIFFTRSRVSRNASFTSCGVTTESTFDVSMTYGSVFDCTMDAGGGVGAKARITVTSATAITAPRSSPKAAPSRR